MGNPRFLVTRSPNGRGLAPIGTGQHQICLVRPFLRRKAIFFWVLWAPYVASRGPTHPGYPLREPPIWVLSRTRRGSAPRDLSLRTLNTRREKRNTRNQQGLGTGLARWHPHRIQKNKKSADVAIKGRSMEKNTLPRSLIISHQAFVWESPSRSPPPPPAPPPRPLPPRPPPSAAASTSSSAAASGREARRSLSGLCRRSLEPLPPVLEPDLDRARRHAQALRERLLLFKVGQRLLVEGLDENRKISRADLGPAELGPAWVARRVRLREARRRQEKREGAAGARATGGGGRRCVTGTRAMRVSAATAVAGISSVCSPLWPRRRLDGRLRGRLGELGAVAVARRARGGAQRWRAVV